MAHRPMKLTGAPGSKRGEYIFLPGSHPARLTAPPPGAWLYNRGGGAAAEHGAAEDHPVAQDANYEEQLPGDDADSDEHLSGQTEIGDGILIIDGYAVPVWTASSIAPFIPVSAASTSSAGTRDLLTADDGRPFVHHATDQFEHLPVDAAQVAQLPDEDADSDEHLSGQTEIGDGILIIDGYAVPVWTASSIAPCIPVSAASTSSAGTRDLLTADHGGPIVHHAADHGSPFVHLAASASAEQWVLQQGDADSPPREPNPVPSTRALGPPPVVASASQIPGSLSPTQSAAVSVTRLELLVSGFDEEWGGDD